jgi:SAM-dependent methyltransferase
VTSVDPKTPTKAERARSFATVASEYDRGRPEYPRAAIEWLLGTTPLDVLDLGAGTGKLTAGLLDARHRVIAVEPLTEMREILAASLPQAQVLAGTAEQLPLEDASVDAVVVGAAFHWFEQEPALAEIARVLRPPGILGLLGNGFDTSTAWVARVREILGPPAIERPGHWPSEQLLHERFTEIDDCDFRHVQRIDRTGLRDLASSRSTLAVMSAVERQGILESLDRLWEQEPELVGRNEAELPWRTRVRRCRRIV